MEIKVAKGSAAQATKHITAHIKGLGPTLRLTVNLTELQALRAALARLRERPKARASEWNKLRRPTWDHTADHHYRINAAQWRAAMRKIEKAMGLTTQPSQPNGEAWLRCLEKSQTARSSVSSRWNQLKQSSSRAR